VARLSLARRRRAWRELLYDTCGEDGESAAQARLEKLEVWRRDRWAYLTGTDVPTERSRAEGWPDGRPIIWTIDEIDEANPIKPFPGEKEYLREVMTELWAHRIVGIDKIRQKYISTLAMLNIDHYAAFYPEREILVSKQTEELAVKLLNDKLRTVHARKPAWLREACPVTDKPAKVATYTASGSTVTAVAENFADRAGRGVTASLTLVDEAALMEPFEEIYHAILPMRGRLWFVSTPNIGNPGAVFMKQLVHEGRPGHEGRVLEEEEAA
jgi:hypothetical protein